MIGLDTHTLIWWLADKRKLSAKARRLIDKESTRPGSLCVSSISIWEISMLVLKQRLAFTRNLEDWISNVEAVDAIRFIPVSNRIALRSTQLPAPMHKDPADRIIIATMRELGTVLVTADERIRGYPLISTWW